MVNMEEDTCTITVDNEYEKVGESDHDNSAYEPEETYIVPNGVKRQQEEENNGDLPPETVSPETNLTDIIMIGDKEDLKKLLTSEVLEITIMMEGEIHPLDLAMEMDRMEMLEMIVEYLVVNEKVYLTQLLMSGKLISPGDVIEAVTRMDINLYSDILDLCVEYVTDSDPPSLMLNLTPLPPSLLPTLLTQHTHLLSHPIVEATVNIYYKTVRQLHLADLALHLTVCLLVSLSLCWGDWRSLLLLSLALLIQLFILTFHLLMTVNCDVRLKSRRKLKVDCDTRLRSWWELAIRGLSVLFMVGMMVSSVMDHEVSNKHVSAWSVLLVFSLFFFKLGDVPVTFFYVHIFFLVLKVISRFFLTVSSLIIGFCLAFHVIGHNSFSSTVNSLFKVLSMMVGEITFDTTFSDEIVTTVGTSQIIFLLFFLTVNLVTMNILLVLTLSTVKYQMMKKDQLIRNMTLMSVCKLIWWFSWTRNWFMSKGGCQFISGNISMSLKEDNMSQIVIKEDVTYKVYKVFENGDEIPVGVSVSDTCWETAMNILEKRKEKQKEEEEREMEEIKQKQKEQEIEDYTSLLYSQENQYEEVGVENKFGLKNMKECLLRELKRDLTRLLRVNKDYSDIETKSSKSVNVRPGLALGVITLQAGANGINPNLHIEDTK